jgi:2-polyprenyl-3-methyl-5-hydroxy-6-metoxy-1,4-benzoquinol methylase
MAKSVHFKSRAGEVLYRDSEDHFRNATLRLLGFEEADFLRWLDALERQGGAVGLKTLSDSFRSLDPQARWLNPPPGDIRTGGPYGLEGHLMHAAIAERPAYGVAASADGSFGWLVRPERQGVWVQEDTPPEYSESYFEGDKRSDGGYGSYSEQASWRLEKASRQVETLQRVTGLSAGRALDVGSGYGYFRKALDDAGFAHDGIELSPYARRRCEELFGFETLPGPFNDDLSLPAQGYDLVTLWDTLEHVEDPLACLRTCRAFLGPSGFLAVRTPNLRCPEHEVFGGAYHSLKRDHLYYFTPGSLTSFAVDAGFQTVSMETTSHLLAGFFPPEALREWESKALGSDMVAVFQRC